MADRTSSLNDQELINYLEQGWTEIETDFSEWLRDFFGDQERAVLDILVSANDRASSDKTRGVVVRHLPGKHD